MKAGAEPTPMDEQGQPGGGGEDGGERQCRQLRKIKQSSVLKHSSCQAVIGQTC